VRKGKEGGKRKGGGKKKGGGRFYFSDSVHELLKVQRCAMCGAQDAALLSFQLYSLPNVFQGTMLPSPA
jgi:hypothetical protein